MRKFGVLSAFFQTRTKQNDEITHLYDDLSVFKKFRYHINILYKILQTYRLSSLNLPDDNEYYMGHSLITY